MKKILAIMLTMLTIPIVTNAEQTITYNEVGEAIYSDSKIFKTITTLSKEGEIIDSVSFEITEEEYENNVITPEEYLYIRTNSMTRGNSATHTTNAKRLTLSIIPTGVSINQKEINIELEWLTMPNVRLYDVIGWRIGEGDVIVTNEAAYEVKQIYDGQTITYTSGSGNRVNKRNGDALVMNIVNDAEETLKITYKAETVFSSNFTVHASYQHATSTSITPSEAKSLTFGGSTSSSNKMVLGNAFIYSTTIGNKYDRMAGVSVTFDPWDI